MKAETIQVPKEQTVEELLATKGLKASLYIVTENGKIRQASETLKAGSQVKIVPAIKGG